MCSYLREQASRLGDTLMCYFFFLPKENSHKERNSCPLCLWTLGEEIDGGREPGDHQIHPPSSFRFTSYSKSLAVCWSRWAACIRESSQSCSRRAKRQACSLFFCVCGGVRGWMVVGEHWQALMPLELSFKWCRHLFTAPSLTSANGPLQKITGL